MDETGQKMSREEVLDEIDEVLDRAQSEELEQRYDLLLSLLKSERAELAADERAYLVGYVRYLHPRTAENEEAKSESRAELLKAIEVTGDQSIAARASLYLGHLSFDSGEFEDARRWFAGADVEALSDYLRLKAKELIVCCNLETYGLMASVPSLNAFVDHAQNAELQDVWPRQLASVLTRVRQSQMGQGEQRALAGIAERLDAAGEFGSWFEEIFRASPHDRPRGPSTSANDRDKSTDPGLK